MLRKHTRIYTIYRESRETGTHPIIEGYNKNYIHYLAYQIRGRHPENTYTVETRLVPEIL